jgi:maltooligosyltrehalose trehalohydrolase
MSQFRSAATRSLVDALPDPHDEATFRRCKLRHAEREQHTAAAALHRDLLRMRRDDPIFSTAAGGRMDGAVLSDRAFLLRWFSSDPRHPGSRDRLADDRLLLVNLGADLSLRSAPEPLLAPAAGTAWEILWSSEDPAYGGMGTAALEADNDWRIPGHAAVVLVSRRS